MRYRRKLIEVEAVQWTGDNLDALLAMLPREQAGAIEQRAGIEYLIVHTSSGTVNAFVGDFIVLDAKGVPYPVRADIFAETYEAAEP